jgi:hypothetical protein
MSGNLPDDVVNDELAVSLARMLAVANRRAGELGVNAQQSLITITQQIHGADTRWRINYGVKNYVGRRGGDLIIELDPRDGSIQNERRGQ